MGCKARAADCRIDNNERFYMAQIQKGTTYGATAPDNLVTYTNLNAHVDSAVLLPGAITDQTSLSTTAAGDYALVSDTDASGALKKVTLANLIPDSGIATAKIADDAVTNAKLADDAVDSPQIADGAIDAVHLASDSVITAKILDGNVTAAKLASTLDLSGKTLTMPVGYSSTAAGTLAQGTLTFAHGFAAVPSRVRVVLVCQTGGDLDWAEGDELGVDSVVVSGFHSSVKHWADATNVKVYVASATNYTIRPSSNAEAALTAAKWKVKVYADK